MLPLTNLLDYVPTGSFPLHEAQIHFALRLVECTLLLCALASLFWAFWIDRRDGVMEMMEGEGKTVYRQSRKYRLGGVFLMAGFTIHQIFWLVNSYYIVSRADDWRVWLHGHALETLALPYIAMAAGCVMIIEPMIKRQTKFLWWVFTGWGALMVMVLGLSIAFVAGR